MPLHCVSVGRMARPTLVSSRAMVARTVAVLVPGYGGRLVVAGFQVLDFENVSDAHHIALIASFKSCSFY